MFYLIGIVIVFVSVIAGYTAHGGNLSLLYQPSEFLIVLGTGVGSVIIGFPFSTLKKSLSGVKDIIKQNPYSKQDYMDLLLFCFNMFRVMKINGMIAVESHLELPEESEVFQASPVMITDETMRGFAADNLRLLTMGLENPYHFEDAMNQELELYKDSSGEGAEVYITLGDSLPALGIVAAVLGVIVTMKSIMEPPDVLGASIGAALVGTFLGVLTSYGFVGPMGNFLRKYSELRVKFMECAKVGFVAYVNGQPPVVAVEFMRKNIPQEIRPSFEEMDRYLNDNSIRITKNER